MADRALTDRVNWAGMSHRELYDAATVGCQPDEAYSAGQEWHQLGSDMIDGARAFGEQLDASEPGWQGEAADTARAAARRLTDWCDQAGGTAQGIGDCVTEQARAAETAATKMPEPVEFDLGGTVDGFAGGGSPMPTGDVQAMDEQARAAQECAAEVMCEMEECCAEVDGNTPECPPPPEVVNDSSAGTGEPEPLFAGDTSLGRVEGFEPGTGTTTPAGSGGLTTPGSAGQSTPFQTGTTSPSPSAGGLGDRVGATSGLGVGSSPVGPRGSSGSPVGSRSNTGAPVGSRGGSGAPVSPRGGAVVPPAGPRSGAVPPVGVRPGAAPPGVPEMRGPGGVGGHGLYGGAPGAAGWGEDIEHKAPGYLAGEKVFEPRSGQGPVIGEDSCAGTQEGGPRCAP